MLQDPAVDILDRQPLVGRIFNGHEDQAAEGVRRFPVGPRRQVVRRVSVTQQGVVWGGRGGRGRAGVLAVRVLQRGDATQPRVAEAVEEVGALVEPGQAGELLVLRFGERRGQRQGQVRRLRLGGVALPVRRTHALRGAGSATGALGLLTGGHGGSHPAQGSLLDDGGTEEAGRGGGKEKWKKQSQLIKFTSHLRILLA